MVEVQSYSELLDYMHSFSSGDLSFLIIESRGGVGKSYHANYLLPDDNTVRFNGHTTPYSLFKTVESNPNKFLVFDDVDTLLDNKTNVALLKQICDTTDERRVTWHTTRGGENVTEEFLAYNQSLILSNDVKHNNDNLNALHDRAITIHFNPTNEQILEQLKQFCNADEVITFLDEMDIPACSLSFRDGIKAEQLQKAGLDWKKYLKQSLNTDKIDSVALAKQLAERAENEDDFTKMDAVAEYRERTGRSQKSYYNDLEK